MISNIIIESKESGIKNRFEDNEDNIQNFFLSYFITYYHVSLILKGNLDQIHLGLMEEISKNSFLTSYTISLNLYYFFKSINNISICEEKKNFITNNLTIIQFLFIENKKKFNCKIKTLSSIVDFINIFQILSYELSLNEDKELFNWLENTKKKDFFFNEIGEYLKNKEINNNKTFFKILLTKFNQIYGNFEIEKNYGKKLKKLNFCLKLKVKLIDNLIQENENLTKDNFSEEDYLIKIGQNYKEILKFLFEIEENIENIIDFEKDYEFHNFWNDLQKKNGFLYDIQKEIMNLSLKNLKNLTENIMNALIYSKYFESNSLTLKLSQISLIIIYSLRYSIKDNGMFID